MNSFHTGGRARALSTTAILAAGLVLAPAAAATAESSDAGYARLAHLSIDTAEVDVTLTALSGGTVLYALSDVGYGAVSNYMELEEGTYSIAMVPAGSPSGTTPVVTASVDITPGTAQTLAVVGENADLETLAFEDELEAPRGNDSRVRVIQAATGVDRVSVETADGTALLDSGELGAAGEYVDVPSGTVELTLDAGKGAEPASVDLDPGAVHTLFVLSTADGALTVSAVVDTVGVTQPPAGGVDTGGGALARAAASADAFGTAGSASVLLLAVLGTALLARFAARRGAAGGPADGDPQRLSR
jgi:hypothetical protein